MPLNRPALSLGAGPRGVQDARRWVVSTFRDLGRDDLVETSEVAVSELVTNAMLHGSPPISVRVRGTRDHPIVEVSDGSTDAPSLPTPPPLDELDSMLFTFGRGLSIVARASQHWGADIDDEGKTVWFTPASDFAEDDGAEGLITVVPGIENVPEKPREPVRLVIREVPVRDYLSFHNHFRELRREVRLLAIAHEGEPGYPLAKDLADTFARLGSTFTRGTIHDEVQLGVEAGREAIDLEVVMGRQEALGVQRFIELLELTDAFAREEKMLSLERTTRQHSFQNWFLGEFVRQAQGDEPRVWVVPPETVELRRTSVS